MPEGKAKEIDRWIEEGIKAGLLVWDSNSKEAFSTKEQALHRLRGALFFAKRLGQTEKVGGSLS